MITTERLFEVLEYEPLTGHFIWKVNMWRNKLIGKRAGTVRKDGYRTIKIDNIIYLSGRLAFFYMKGRWPDPEIDHENRIRDDDRWDNLRECTKSLNRSNQNYKGKANLERGITYSENMKFVVRLYKNKKQVYLGRFLTLIEAKLAIERFRSGMNVT